MRKQIELKNSDQYREHYCSSCTTATMAWDLCKLLFVILLVVSVIDITKEKITLNEDLYSQCTNACAKVGSKVLESNDYQASCIASCNNFYMNIIKLRT
jgi:hypothetical protein